MPTAGPEATRLLTQYSVLTQLHNYIALYHALKNFTDSSRCRLATLLHCRCKCRMQYRSGMASHNKLCLSWTLGSDFVTIMTEDREVTVMCASLFFAKEKTAP